MWVAVCAFLSALFLSLSLSTSIPTLTLVKNCHVRPMKYASVSFAMIPALTASPNAIGSATLASPICSARENRSGASDATLPNLGCALSSGLQKCSISACVNSRTRSRPARGLISLR